jgi:hypothetical protein
MQASFPAGFSAHAVFRGRLGAIHIGSRPRPPCLWNKPNGYIGPSLLRREHACAEEFARQHPEGWVFVVDTSSVRLINPINPLFTRRLLRLPNIRAYIAIAPRWIRVLAWIGRPIFRPTHLVRTEAEALDIVADL